MCLSSQHDTLRWDHFSAVVDGLIVDVLFNKVFFFFREVNFSGKKKNMVVLNAVLSVFTTFILHPQFAPNTAWCNICVELALMKN